MKVLLKENVENCGALGDEVEVKPGYARNYLIPKNKALPINKENYKRLAHQRKVIEEKRQKTIDDLQKIADKIAQTEISFLMKAPKEGKLFGSVSSKQILDELAKKDIKIERKVLTLTENLKTAGLFKIPLKLHPKVAVDLAVRITADYGKGENQETLPTAKNSESSESDAKAQLEDVQERTAKKDKEIKG